MLSRVARLLRYPAIPLLALLAANVVFYASGGYSIEPPSTRDICLRVRAG
jgi:hypothetical protein